MINNKLVGIRMFRDDYGFLSNFYPCSVVYEGIRYPSSEHAYQAAKTLKISDRNKIAKLWTATSAKRMGRRIELRKDWQEIRLQIMREIVLAKFQDNEFLKERLLATGQIYLEEGNWWKDTFWGVCQGKGSNHLGKILMEVRETLGGGK